ncbi:hypothetical protein C2S51_024263 [Perilla frutescens var. frutescens]|nr:hypothetical protein C2S51_024263 [Perilla frutescens var. frutescens]
MAFSSMQQTSKQRYEMVDHEVAKGGFGHVYKIKDKQIGSDVAMKSIPFTIRKNGLPTDVLREISILKELNHENVVRLLYVSVTPTSFNLFFEWLDYDLNKMVKGGTKDPRLTKSLLFQTLQAVSYCHSQKVLHRDLKPHNLLLDTVTNKLKLADFGYARTFDDAVHEYSNEVATLAYKAPELLLRNNPYTTAVDMWSVGCIFAELVIGKPLFSGTTDTLVMRKIINMLGVPNELDWPGIKSECLKVCEIEELPPGPLPEIADVVPGLEPAGQDLLSKMLRMIPSRRITAFDALVHPYFKDCLTNPSD